MWFVYALWTRRGLRVERWVWIGLGIVALYFGYFGAFPRQVTRAALPIVPIVMLLSGYLIRSLPRQACIALLAPILAYNVLCSANVGIRFRSDPRMYAQRWVLENVPRGSSIETTGYCPRFDKLYAMGALNVLVLPFVSGRGRLFSSLVKDDESVRQSVLKLRRREDEFLQMYYTEQQLNKRAPDYVATNSRYYSRYTNATTRRALYPEMVVFFDRLLGESYGYEIVLDRTSPTAPWWVYPRTIDVLHNRMVIPESTE